MTIRHRKPLFAALLLVQLAFPLLASAENPNTADPNNKAESGANSVSFPSQILKSGVILNATEISPNSQQLADTIRLSPLLERIQTMRSQSQDNVNDRSLEAMSARLDFWDTVQKASMLIQKTNLEIDFAVAEIEAEQQVYEEILATFTADRDKLVARVNAASFISNGILWAACEAMAIPTINPTFAKNPRNVFQWAVPSGITGIAAGIVPSIASMYTLKAVNGKKKTSEVDPNMLAKLFGYPTNPEIEYPNCVWEFLHQVPADTPTGKKRVDQLIDRWISDSNIPSFNDRKSKKQLDVLTASIAQKKGLTISTLSARIVMLRQLHAEVYKMKRMLLELSMAVQGDKRLIASESMKLR